MSAHERQRWLAALALAVALPLPLTGLAGWGFLLPFVAVAAWSLASGKATRSLPVWAENVLAPAILAVVVVTGGVRFGILRPLTHLALLVAAVRLPGCGSVSRARSTGVLLALLGGAAVASSTHPSLALYLLGLLVAVAVAVGRGQLLGMAGRDALRGRPAHWPPARLVAGTVGLSVLVAVPVFTLLPRLRSPFAGSPFGPVPMSGFRNSVTLHAIGDIKASQEVALLLHFSGGGPATAEWLRLTGATLATYRAGSWIEGRTRGSRLAAGPDGWAPLGGATRRGDPVLAEITLVKPADNLFLPPGATALRPPARLRLRRDPLGTLRIPRGTEVPLQYEVLFDGRTNREPPPGPEDLEVPARIEPTLRELSDAMVGGVRGGTAKAAAIEVFLQENYGYTLRTNAPVREDPVIWFLLRGRAGHCEFFAAAMTLLLRTQGIPARLQVGFAGGAADGEGGYVVRDSQAHAWVVAHVDGVWRVFDPTPPDGQPGMLAAGEGGSPGWSWEQVEAAWDRWVLTFSLADQVELLRSAAARVWDRRAWLGFVAAVVLVGLAAAAAARRVRGLHLPRWLTWPGRRGELVSEALRRVREAASRRGLPVSPATTPQRFGVQASRAFPAAAGSLAWLLAAHERAVYAQGEPPSPGELRRHEREILRALSS